MKGIKNAASVECASVKFHEIFIPVRKAINFLFLTCNCGALLTLSVDI